MEHVDGTFKAGASRSGAESGTLLL